MTGSHHRAHAAFLDMPVSFDAAMSAPALPSPSYARIDATIRERLEAVKSDLAKPLPVSTPDGLIWPAAQPQLSNRALWDAEDAQRLSCGETM